MELKAGDCIQTQKGNVLRVKDEIGNGGQGWVYSVECAGQIKALKIYKPDGLRDQEKFIKNLEENASLPEPPSPFLVWPQDVVKLADGSYGYVMEMVQKPFINFERFLLPLAKGGVRFASFKAMTDAMMNVVSAFQRLHIKGYSYQDLNNGNLFFNPANGDVKICDNDNVAPNKTYTGIIGKPRFIAPEVILGKNMPDTFSDRFSLAIILFMIATISHPLEGHRFLRLLLSPEHERQLYAEDPVFVMSKTDTRNNIRPEEREHFVNLLWMWRWMPGELRELFEKAFSEEVIKTPAKRIREDEWMNVLLRVRNRFVTCPRCGKETVQKRPDVLECEDCGQKTALHVFQNDYLPYDIPIAYNAALFEGHLGVPEQGKGCVMCVRVAKNKANGAYFLQNVSQEAVWVQTQDGKRERCLAGKAMPLQKVQSILIHDTWTSLK